MMDSSEAESKAIRWFSIEKEAAVAFGRHHPNGFLVEKGSTAMREGSPNKKRNRKLRDQLVRQGILVPDENPALLRFAEDYVFTSKSAAAGVVIDGNSNGSHWKPTRNPNGFTIDSVAITRWITRLRDFFPNLDRFDRPDPDFDARERDYKLETANRLRERLARASSDQDIADAVHAALSGSNLLPWRAYWPMSPTGDADRSRLWPALARLVEAASGDPAGHPDALEAFTQEWIRSVPDGKAEPARQIAEFLFLHLNPEAGIYIRHTVRQDFWLEAVGSRFPEHASMADTYREELRFMQAVKQAFEDRGLAPRDMIDVQSALWVVHNYKDEDMASTTGSNPGRGPEMITTAPNATNLILYGPPGTGKTYETAWEAVRLCLGDDAAEPLRDDRKALMGEYRRLLGEGRIVFVTFHQSMSYEEFVEGLRPVTGAATEEEAETAGDDEAAQVGFRLAPVPGIFREISEKAEAKWRKSAGARLDPDKRIARFALRGVDWKEKLRRAIETGMLEWEYGRDIDWSAPEFEDLDAIKARIEIDGPAVRKFQPAVFGTWMFRGRLETGEYVILTHGQSRIHALGRISGDYRFEPAADGRPARHLRPVTWEWHDEEGIDSSRIYRTSLGSGHPLYRLFEDKLDRVALERAIFGAALPETGQSGPAYVLIIDEINRANISKVFGELITLLEPDKRLGQENEIRLTLPYSKKEFGVPSNLHIIGTMNTADRSIALLDTALRRRFRFRELMPRPDLLSRNVEGIDLRKLLTRLNERIEYLFDREHQIGHAYFIGCTTRADVEAVMREAVIPLLAEYFYEDWSKIWMVLEGSSVPESGDPSGRFLYGRRIVPAGFDDDAEDGLGRVRWSVRPSFDFSEFATE